MDPKKYDVFVSNASKDKKDYVDSLVDALKETGLKVFYDTDSIEHGDSITRLVHEGLYNCRFAVEVIIFTECLIIAFYIAFTS